MKDFLMQFRNHPQTDKKPEHRPARERAADEVGDSRATQHDGAMSVELVTESGVLSIPEHLMKGRNIALFRLKGEGLPGDHLYPGDFLIVERRTVPGDGDLVVATLSNSSIVLGRFFRNDDGIRIDSVNPAGSSLQVSRTGLAVQGVVLGILRKYGTREEESHVR